MASLKDTVVLGKLSILGNTHTATLSSGGSIGVNGSIYLSGSIYHNSTGSIGGTPSDGGTIGSSGAGAFSTAYVSNIYTNCVQGINNVYCKLAATGDGWKLYDSDKYGNILPGSDGTGTLGKSNLLFNKVFTEYLEVLNINKYLAVYSKSLSATTTNQLLWSIPWGTCGKIIISSGTENAIYNIWQGSNNSENWRCTVEYNSFKSTYLTPSMSSGGYIYVKMSSSSGNQTIYAILLAVHNGLVTKKNAGIIAG